MECCSDDFLISGTRRYLSLPAEQLGKSRAGLVDEGKQLHHLFGTKYLIRHAGRFQPDNMRYLACLPRLTILLLDLMP